MARLRLGRSYWLAEFDGHSPRFPSFRGTHHADVAIVGGGITGCAAALLFSRAGASVILVDAARIGRGSTAASTALLMQEPDTDYVDLMKRYGRGVTTRIWRCCRGAVSSMRDMLEDLDVPAVHTLPSVYLTRDPDGVAKLRREASARARAGLPVRFMEGEPLRALVGFDAPGGIVTPGNAHVDPYRACLAFAHAAAHSGAELFERSPLRRIRACRNGVSRRHTALSCTCAGRGCGTSRLLQRSRPGC